jgi:hypothetical protein
MDTWLLIPVLVIYVGSTPLEAHLWRNGRLSDRALALLVVGRFPILVAACAILVGTSPAFAIVVVPVALLPGFFLYRYVLEAISNEHGARGSSTRPDKTK